MPKEAAIYIDKGKEERIKAEIERISIFFEDMREAERAVIDPVIRNAAFMRVTLDDLQELISETGVIEEYQNGENQRGMKQSAALQSYNSTIKNYAAVIKSLFSLLPKTSMREPGGLSYIPEKTPEQLKAEKLAANLREWHTQAEIELCTEYQQQQRNNNLSESYTSFKNRKWKSFWMDFCERHKEAMQNDDCYEEAIRCED